MNMRNISESPGDSEADRIMRELRQIKLEDLYGANINQGTFTAAMNLICRYVQDNGRVPDSDDELRVKSDGRKKEVARKILEFYNSDKMNPIITGGVALLESILKESQAEALDRLAQTNPELCSGGVYNRLCRYVKTKGQIYKLSDLGSWQPNTLAKAEEILDAAGIRYEE